MADRADLIQTTERRRWVLQRRRQGDTVREIAEAAVEHFGEEQLPNSWDMDGRYVSKDLKRALKQAREEVDEIAEDYRELHVNRLENLLSELWPYAQEHTEEVLVDEDTGEAVEVTKPPDARIVDRVLAIMDRLAKFHHVEDAPERASNPGSNETNVFLQVNQKLKEATDE
jgi:uncharacterized protein (DUF433 family)